MTRVIIATKNQNKVREFSQIFATFNASEKLNFEVLSRDAAGVPDFEIVEDGETFEENSYKKAYEIMKASGEIAIADDSGLMVDYLDGAPGVYSSRFAGEDGNNAANNQKLLKLLEGVPFEQRTARFVSVITMIWPDGRQLVARGEVEGHIATGLTGDCGFGYDPLFIPLGYDRSFGEFGADEKNAISHRGNALKRLRELLIKEF